MATRALSIRIAAIAVAALAALAVVLGRTDAQQPPPRSSATDVFLNVMASGAKQVNVVIPDFAVAGGPDPGGLAKQLPAVAGQDLRYDGRFAVVTGAPPLPSAPDAFQKALEDAAAAGGHAVLQGILTPRGATAAVEIRLFDLGSRDLKPIATKRIELPATDARRLAHKIADDVVLQFTGEAGISDTKIAFIQGRGQVREVTVADYDGAAPVGVTANRAIVMSPAWSPDTRSVAFTSYMGGYPYLYRLFPFERRPVQLLAGFTGINTSPAWSPDGRAVAFTASRDGNPEIYLLTLATMAMRRLTSHPGIDTEPTWSPTGREIAFTSNRSGPAQIFVMDAEGANVRRVTQSGFNTQPRWSPKGDAIAFTSRQGLHDLWAVAPDGSNLRRLTAGPGDNESASWSPDGRHLAFHSNRGIGRFQLYTMLADGSAQVAVAGVGSEEARSPAWSPRLP
jgi:TolB protein